MPSGPTTFNSGFDAVKALRAVIAPTSIGEGGQAESTIRENVGQGNRDTEITRAALEDQHVRVNQLTPQEKYDFFRYVQNRSKGFPLNDPSLQPLADTMRDAAQTRELKLRAMPSTAQMNFQQDYLQQLWTDPAKAQQFFGGVRQGGGGFTRAKDIPTIDEGIAAGLQLKTDNPIDMTMNYVMNADRFIALNSARDAAVGARLVRYIQDPRTVPDGWVPLQGRLGNKYGPAGPIQGYAPEAWARVWNNFVGQGIHGDWGKLYDTAMHGMNAIQALEFGFSAYHGFTVAMKAPTAELGRAFQAIVSGRPGAALKAAANATVAPVSLVRQGMASRDIFLNKRAGSPIDQRAVEALTKANHRFIGTDPSGEYEFSPMRNYWTSFRRGALKNEAMQDFAGVAQAPVKGIIKFIFRHVGRFLQTASAPLFKHYIPMLKNGAAFNAMKQWLESNPTATHAQTLKAARDIADHVDNMMGEMVHDNIFWMKTQKQIAQMSMTSFSWTFGNARWAGGAFADLASLIKGKGLSYRTASLIAYPIILGTIAAIAQKLMTGKDPETVQDLIAPRTGGTVQSGRNMVEERLMIPGSHKDWLGWYENAGQEAWNKVHRGIRIGTELATGRDWRNDPISKADRFTPQWLQDYFNHVAKELSPIPFQQSSQSKRGSNIPTAAKFLGFREAPMYLENPKGYAAMQKYQALKANAAKARHDATDRRYRGIVE